jgi:hypothetical protein
MPLTRFAARKCDMTLRSTAPAVYLSPRPLLCAPCAGYVTPAIKRAVKRKADPNQPTSSPLPASRPGDGREGSRP